MKRFLVVQHSYSEFLGAVERQLENRGIGFGYVRPFAGQALPGNVLQYDALWLLGGAHAVSDHERSPWIDDELRLIAAFERARRPIVGLGFGALLLARATGGAAHAEPAQRAYFARARRTGAGRGDPLAEALDGRTVLVMANGRVELPPGIAPILTDEAGEWIAVRPREFAYGLLFRPELTPGMLEDMVMEKGRVVPDNIGELIADARGRLPEGQRTTELAVAALVAALELTRERRKPPVFAINPVRSGG